VCSYNITLRYLGNRLPWTIIPYVHNKTKLAKLALILLVMVLPTLSAIGQTPQERHSRIKSALESGDTNAAITELNASRNLNAALFARNNYDYLLGRLIERTGQIPAAAASYQSVVARNSPLSSYALWHLAQLARSTGDLTLERERLRNLIARAPASLLRDAVILRLGQSFFESKDYSAAAAALRPITSLGTQSITREALALTGDALQNAGKSEEARDLFRKLVMQMPDASRPDDFALAAVRGLDKIESSNTAPDQAPQLSEADHILRASVYQFNRDFDAARKHYAVIVDRYPQSPTIANSLYQIGRGFYLQARYDEALKYFQQVLDKFPESSSARDAQSFTAGSYNRLKRTNDAVVAYKRFIDRFPDAPNPERSYLNIIDALHEAGRHKEALDWAQQTRTRFRGQIGEALALFAQTRIHLAQSSWPAVIADVIELRKMSDLGGTRVPGGTTPSELTFIRAYALEQLGRHDEAISEYLSIPDGRNEYYGKRATQRLLALGANAGTRRLIESRRGSLRSSAENAINSGQYDQGRAMAQNALRLTDDDALRDETLELVLRAYESLPAYKLPSFNLLSLGRQNLLTGPEDQSQEASHQLIADELLFLGLYDEGVPEFAAARTEFKATATTKPVAAAVKSNGNESQSASETDLNYSLAVLSLRGGFANRAVRFGEQAWRPVPQDYVLEQATRQMVDLLYPLPFRESLLKHAPPRSVDPRLVISIARQESRFQPDAKSVAAARGLMQFISATANDMAGQLGLSDFKNDRLYNPDTAIMFGSHYLTSLFQQFPAQPQAVAAAYNGGPDNVARWVARSRSTDPDRYVAEIGFSQTKDYVYKVLTNFWIYQQLYDEKLERK